MKTMKKFMLIGTCTALILTGCQAKEDQTAVVSKPSSTKTVEAYGVVKPSDSLNIVIDFPAMIQTLPVVEGQRVKKGEVLATLNIDSYLSQIQAKLIEVQIAKQEKAKILSSTTLTLLDDLQYQKLKESVKLAESSYKQAEKDYKANEALFQSDGISQVELDRYKDQYDTKKKLYEDTAADLEQYERSKKGVSNDIGIRDLQATASQLSVDTMRNKLDRSFIQKDQVLSPYDEAVVYEISYRVGDAVDASRKLMALADTTTLKIEAEITEEFIGDIQQGAAVTIIPVADRTKTYHGKVSRVSGMGVVRNGETIVVVEISIDDNDGFLKPNYNVDVSIDK